MNTTSITGLSYGFHDAGYALIKNNKIIECHHAERFTKIKNDKNPVPIKSIGKTAYYERPRLKNTRRFYAGQSWKSDRPKHDFYIPHHWSHAAAAYYTRPFGGIEPVCVVIDAIGEWDTVSIWYKKKKVWSKRYPYSIGLFYSAITQHIGLKPNEDEYITMGMAAFGEPVVDLEYLFEENLHMGIRKVIEYDIRDIAASAQALTEKKIIKIMQKAKKYSDYLCYGGGVALNCVANSKIYSMFKNIWIMPSPGDSGSALGAALAVHGKRVEWTGPYLGYDIIGQVDPKEVVKHLLKYQYCGVANGKAEFGPRALGNRSLLADPRLNIKDTVNNIKQRQQFRPFAPAILEEHAEDYFEGPMNQYMQYVAKAKHDYKSVTHIDGTARVQVVKKDCTSIIRPILEEWYNETGCPMLLNTSLNIKGQPIVNSWLDALEFQKQYGVKVF